ncbi:MAG TPA: AAA family ATPase [Deltaproteobacteria bacterium]|nr:AAA family ATPase [Deltaproteobacteria bacterium]HQB39353.1 AAA family ATPase [Deltaproteobacteria bacterium]
MIKNHLKYLMKPDAYPDPTNNVELVQTHVSWIFLTDSKAYKVKKPVDYGFLNFSTIDRRRFYCNEEVRLNQRLCPDVYERVVEINKVDGVATINGDGPVIDYAVQMKRLPRDRMMNHLLDSGIVSNDDMREIAHIIARFHNTTLTSPAISAYGEPDRIMFNWAENFEQSEAFADSTLPSLERQFIQKWVTNFVASNHNLFQQRIAEGHIRECDGDIHLENICMTDGRIYIFDCIEFNERFRCCDTASDIAFLLMDLDYHGHRDMSEVVANTYLETSGDHQMLQLLDFYKVYRAFVRGKVESLKAFENGMDVDEKERANIRARKYFRLARGYIERRRLNTFLLITCGLTGCGKSTLADQLSFELGINVFNSDMTRKHLAGITPQSSAANSFGQGLYTNTATRKTYSALAQYAQKELRSDRPVIIDASFGDRKQRVLFRSIAKKLEAAFWIIHLLCNDTENRRRLTERAMSGSHVSDGTESILNIQQSIFEIPTDEEEHVIRVNASRTPEEMANQVYESMSP